MLNAFANLASPLAMRISHFGARRSIGVLASFFANLAFICFPLLIDEIITPPTAAP